MNIQKLYEANILNTDALTAASEFHLDFKREVAKAINNISKVDKLKTFKDDTGRIYNSQTQRYKRLYNEFGQPSKSDRNPDIGIEIYLKNSQRIKLQADSLGNINIQKNGMSYNSKKHIIKMVGKTTKQFLDDLKLEVKKLLDTDYSGDDKSSLDIIPNKIIPELNELFKEDESIKYAEHDTENRGYGSSSRTIHKISIKINNIENTKVTSTYETYYDIYKLIDDTSYLKTVYKKITGKDAGKKGSDYGLANKFFSMRTRLQSQSKEIESFNSIKQAVLETYKVLKENNVKISGIQTLDGYSGLSVIMGVRVDGKNNYTDNRGVTRDRENDFNIYSWIKENRPKETSEDLINIYDKQLNEYISPIGQYIIKYYFKGNE